MYSNLELLIIFFIAFLYVGIFKVQKYFTPLKYFSNEDLVIQESVSFFQVIIRYVLVGIFSISLHILFKWNEKIIIIGNLLGAFLIIWPTLLSPNFLNETYVSKNSIRMIYFVHLIYVGTTGLVTYLSLILIPFFVRDTSEYFTNILLGGGGLVFGDVIKNKLSSKVLINKNKDENEYNNFLDVE